MTSLRFLIIVVAALLAPIVLLTGCATAPDVATGTSTAFVAMAASDAVPGAGGSQDYHLSPGDLLDITVFQVPDLTKEVEVDPAGRISLPLIGDLSVTGKSPHELEGEIAAKLRAKYMQSPQVSVFLKNAAGRQVTVTGQVVRPGIYPIVGHLTLVQALAQSGDINDVGDPGAVLVFRQGNGSRTVAKFNVDEIRAGKESDPSLAPGDMVVVDSSGVRSVWKNFRDALPAVGVFATTAISAGAL